MAINLYVPPGLGDIYWILSKIIPNTNHNVNLYVHSRPAAPAGHFLQSLKRVNNVYDYTEYARNYSSFVKHCDRLYPTYRKIFNNMWLEANTHLEKGNRIEDYLPHLKKTKFQLEWDITAKDRKISESLLKSGCKNILIYTSAFRNNNTIYNHYKFIKQEPVLFWSSIINKLKQKFSNNINIIWIGANYDSEMYHKLSKVSNIDNHLIQPTPGTVIHLLRKVDGFISYQSGLSILGLYENTPTYMLYFSHLYKLRTSWVPKDSLNNKQLYSYPFFTEVSDNLNLPIEWVKGL